MAEQAGFTFGTISDHFHPWTDRQGQSPFVWTVIGGIAQSTTDFQLGTGVTCPIIRTHPAIIAQAAATSAAIMPGRFFLGLGSGEALNEHILGEQWPPAETRLRMLEEAIYIIRELWRGEEWTHYGEFFTVENARIYTLPDSPPPIMIASGGSKSAQIAAENDGLVSTTPERELIDQFESAGGNGKPKIAHHTVCWAESEEQAVKTALEIWPTAAMQGQLNQELPLPLHFEQAAKMVREDDIAKQVVCGPDPQKHIEGLRRFEAAGFDHVSIHQVGPDQEGFMRFYQREIMPAFKAAQKEPMLAR
jgi:G6PDH family F420-dependent oxidoreductase